MYLDVDVLIKAIEVELEGIPEGVIGPDTVLTEMEEWNSMYALLLMAYVSAEFDIEIRGSDLELIRTPRDLFLYIQRSLRG